MQDGIKITEEIMNGARDYIPLEAKMEFAAKMAPKCFDRMEVTANHNEASEAMPPMYKENGGLKRRYLMTAFVKLYLMLPCETEENDEWLMTVKDYDMYASSHIYAQVNRFKYGKTDSKDKSFELMSDFKDLSMLLDSECYGLIKAMNDPVSRAIAYLVTSISPESIQQSMESLKEVTEQLEEYKQEKESNG